MTAFGVQKQEGMSPMNGRNCMDDGGHRLLQVSICLLTIVAFAIGCSEDSDKPRPALTLVSSNLMNGTEQVDRKATLTLTFSTQLAAETMTAENVKLKNDFNNELAEVELITDGQALNIRPKGILGAAAHYTLTVSPQIRGSEEEAPDGELRLTFTTKDGAWGTATRFEQYPMSNVQVAMDVSGNGVAVSCDDDTKSESQVFSVRTFRYASGKGWGKVDQISDVIKGGEDVYPRVAIDNKGNVISLWSQPEGATSNLLFNHYVAGKGWDKAAIVGKDDHANTTVSQVVIDNNGNGFAVWSQSDGKQYNIWASRYVPINGWTTPELIEKDNNGDAYGPQIAIDATGNALVVWYQNLNFNFVVWANRYSPSSGWEKATPLMSGKKSDAKYPQVAFDNQGNAVAVWSIDGLTTTGIWAARYVASKGWDKAVRVESSGERAYDVQIAIDATGKALVVWVQSDGMRDSIWGNWYVPETGWDVPVLLETNHTDNASFPQVVMDASGNALVVWVQDSEGQKSIWTRRFVPSSEWSEPTLVEHNHGNASFPDIAISPSGNAMVLWQQYGDATQEYVWVNHFE